MKKLDYKKWLPKVVVIVLCVFFVGGIFIGAESVMEMEGKKEPYIAAESLSPYPKNDGEVIAYLNAAIEKAIAEKPQLTAEEKCEIDGESVTAGNSQVLTMLNFVRDDFASALAESGTNLSTDYGEDISSYVGALNINEKDIVSCECRYDYYVCPICAEDSDENTGYCDSCDSKVDFYERYRDEYQISIKLVAESDSVKNNFSFRTPEQLEKFISAQSSDFFTYDAPEINYTETEITARVNRLTDKINSISFKLESSVSVDLSFVGDYAPLGTSPVGFAISDENKISFSWPGISLSADTVSVEPKATEVIKAALTCSDPTAYTVRWSISDSSIASIDDEGYVKAGKQSGKATVTAEFDFNGVTYSDSCEVFVKTSVESIDLSKRNLTLGAGDTYQLEATVSPKDSTIQTVTWYSTDESIATVDSSGSITAVSEGEVDIYALSDDGYYKATCKVEVTK